MAGQLDDNDELTENHEINVTPFIDVILVLLIIFMVAAPLATVDIAVDLPQSSAEPQPRPDEPIYVTLEADLTVNIGNESTPRGRIESALNEITRGNNDERLYLRADQQVPYGDLMALMNDLRGIGYTQIALVGEEQVQ